MKNLINKLFKKHPLGVIYNPNKQRYEMLQYGDETFVFNNKTNKIVKHL